ncbi:MAG TPA: hypothetical protein PKC39_11390 [Ferruginibacter sp.]|nr:hypothetical protein [Ferruginibacter sp.]HMP21552.1 hypothetical protein [Ferruginibacter sp.]
MKKIRPVLFFLVAYGSTAFAQQNHQFLHSNFVQYIQERYPEGCITFIPPNYDTIPERPDSGYIITYPVCEAIATEDSLNLSNRNINNFHGVESFTSLQYLDISWSSYDYCPPLPNSVKTFKTNNRYGDGLLNTLPVLSDSLLYLDCSYNSIASLPALPPMLQYLNCSNQDFDADRILKTLPPLPQFLEYLNCSDNGLASLPELPGTLVFLNCSGNARKINPELYEATLKQLPALPPLLKYLYCGYNALEAIPVLPDSMLVLDCTDNSYMKGNVTNMDYSLGSLPALPNSLKSLYCGLNKITQLPVLPAILDTLHCGFNKLTALPALPNSLKSIECMLNNIRCMPRLPVGQNNAAHPIPVKFDADKISCIPNSGHYIFTAYTSYIKPNGEPGYYIQPNYNPPVCTPVNNSNHCTAFPVLKGTVYLDLNQNGIKDNFETYKANIQLQLSNGAFTYTNNNGYYEIAADTIGDFTLSLNLPYYLAAVPVSQQVKFTAYDTAVTQHFALLPSIAFDSVRINITPLLWAARPGFDYNYSIHYENTGTNIVSPVINVSYDNHNLVYTGTTETGIIHAPGNLQLTANELLPGERRDFTANFKVNTNAVLGNSIAAIATISVANASSIDSAVVIVQGSFDPNDKRATYTLTPGQVADGAYIHCYIRFQNTGTDTAFTVVITDTLSSLLQAGTMEILNTSHSCNTLLKGNNICFEFINIMLPDSTINEPASHGFVQFRIKPMSSVTEGDIINNTASIYFDYNAPIVTNTTSTYIQTPEIIIQTYTFTGNGNWSNPANWSNGIVPPASLGNGAQIIIDPSGNGECVVDIPQAVSGKSKITVVTGKKIRMNNNLFIKN